MAATAIGSIKVLGWLDAISKGPVAGIKCRFRTSMRRKKILKAILKMILRMAYSIIWQQHHVSGTWYLNRSGMGLSHIK